jgi:hypothetical protein
MVFMNLCGKWVLLLIPLCKQRGSWEVFSARFLPAAALGLMRLADKNYKIRPLERMLGHGSIRGIGRRRCEFTLMALHDVKLR